MSSSAHDSRGREPRRKKKAVDSDEEAGGEVFTQPRASHQSKKPAPNGKIIINGNVHIRNVEGNLTLFQELKDDPRSQPASNPTRASSRQLQPARNKRLTVQRDSPSASEEDLPSQSDDTDPEYVAPKRPARSMNPPDQLRLHSEKKRRHQLDEGYHSNHTSGTVSYTAQINSKQFMKEKGKERSVSSVDSSSSRPRLSSSAESRKSKGRQNETDATSCHSDVENCAEESAEEDDRTENNVYLEDEEASDDDFSKLAICIARPNDLNGQGIFEKAILDTGTKADWISQMFYDDLRHTGVRSTKLDPKDSEMKYRDFNGKAFKPTGKVDLLIQTEEFKGPIKCRTIKFLIASKATFKIIFGRDTIREHGFYERRKCDTDGEGVLIGVHDELTEAQKAEIKRKKEEKNKIAQERKKVRDTKTEKSVRHKENAATPSSSKVAAHFATSVSRSSKTRSPSKSTKESPRHSSSSMDGTW